MANQSSFSTKKMVSVIVAVEKPLTFSSPVLGLFKSTYSLRHVEILLVGPKSCFNNPAVLKELNLRFKWMKIINSINPNSIFAHVSNLAHGEICLFMTDECWPEKNWIKSMVNTFKMDPQVGMVVGETRWRYLSLTNKVESYCQQVGLESVGGLLDRFTETNLKIMYVDRMSEMNVSRMIHFLKPANISLMRHLLTANDRKDKRVDDQTMVFQMIRKLGAQKLKLIYQPMACLDRFGSMNINGLNKVMQKRAFQKVAWFQEGPSRRARVQINLFGKHEIIFPFLVSVNIVWGDFFWMNFFGLWVLWKMSISVFQSSQGTIWQAADEILLIGCAGSFFAFKYFLPVLKVQPWSDFILWCWIKYRTNMSMFLNGLWAGIKFRCFYWSESW